MSEAPAPQPASRAAAKKELPEHFRGYKHVWVFIEQASAVKFIPSLGSCSARGASLPTNLACSLRRGVWRSGERRRAPLSRKPSAMARTSPISSRIPFSPTTATSPIPKALTQLVNAHKPGDFVARRHDARARSRGLGRDNAADRPHRRLHGVGGRRRRFARRDAPDFGGSLLCTIYTLNYRPQMATCDRGKCRCRRETPRASDRLFRSSGPERR